MNRRKFLEKLGLVSTIGIIVPKLLLESNKDLPAIKPKEILGDCTTSTYENGTFHYDIPIEGMEVTLSGEQLGNQNISVKGGTMSEMKDKLRNYKLPCGNKLSTYVEII